MHLQHCQRERGGREGRKEEREGKSETERRFSGILNHAMRRAHLAAGLQRLWFWESGAVLCCSDVTWSLFQRRKMVRGERSKSGGGREGGENGQLESEGLFI